jgi:hypothetical protein
MGNNRLQTAILCVGMFLLVSAPVASADVCVIEKLSVSKIRGQVKSRQELVEGSPVKVWKSNSRGEKLILVAESETDALGHFSFAHLPSGWYRLDFPLPGFDGNNFLIRLQGRSILHPLPKKNWIQVGLAIASMHCPETTFDLTRK